MGSLDKNLFIAVSLDIVRLKFNKQKMAHLKAHCSVGGWSVSPLFLLYQTDKHNTFKKEFSSTLSLAKHEDALGLEIHAALHTTSATSLRNVLHPKFPG